MKRETEARETNKTQCKEGTASVTTSTPLLHELVQRGENSLYTKCRIRGKPCLMTDTGASVTITWPDIVVGLPERKQSRLHSLQKASWETLPVLKEALVELTLGQKPLHIWVFITEITDEFILRLDFLHTMHPRILGAMCYD
jgi:hypothetical protein